MSYGVYFYYFTLRFPCFAFVGFLMLLKVMILFLIDLWFYVPDNINGHVEMVS